MRYLLSALFLSLSVLTFSQNSTLAGNTVISSVDGSWCDAGTWLFNGPPDPNQDNVIIGGETVNAECEDPVIFGAQSMLRVTGCGTIIFNNVQFNNGCNIQVDSCSTIIILGNLTNNNNSDNVTINGTLQVEGYIDNGVGSSIEGSGTITADSIIGECCVMGWGPDSIPQPATITDSIIEDPVLPVELLYFEARCESNTLIFEWATANETNNNYFIVEESRDGVIWDAIINSLGAGTTSHLTTYHEVADYKEDHSYFRLKQIDYDGTIRCHDVINLDCESFEPEFRFKSLCTNNLCFYTNESKMTRVDIYDCTGKVIYTNSMVSNIGDNIIPVTGMCKDIYVFVFRYGEKIFIEKIYH